jgi:hypothetical protein
MEDRPYFEIKDGAVVHPLIAPNPGTLSPKEKLEAELGALFAYAARGGGGEPWYYAHHREA